MLFFAFLNRENMMSPKAVTWFAKEMRWTNCSYFQKLRHVSQNRHDRGWLLKFRIIRIFVYGTSFCSRSRRFSYTERWIWPKWKFGLHHYSLFFPLSKWNIHVQYGLTFIHFTLNSVKLALLLSMASDANVLRVHLQIELLTVRNRNNAILLSKLKSKT